MVVLTQEQIAENNRKLRERMAAQKAGTTPTTTTTTVTPGIDPTTGKPDATVTGGVPIPVPKPVTPTTPTTSTTTPKKEPKPYQPGAADYVQGDYNKGRDYGDQFSDIFGENVMPSSAEAALRELARSQEAERQYQLNSQRLTKGINQRQLEATKRESEAAQAASVAAFAQNREGAMSGTAQDVISRYAGISNERMQNATDQVALANLQMEEAQRQLRDAQRSGSRAAIERYQGAVAQAEQQIRQANMDLANAESRALSEARQFQSTEATIAKTKQETTLANMEAMGSAVANLDINELQAMGMNSGLSLPQMVNLQKGYQLKAEAAQVKDEAEAMYKMAQANGLIQSVQFQKEDRPLDVRIKEADAIIKEKQSRGEPVTIQDYKTAYELKQLQINQDYTIVSGGQSLWEVNLNEPGENQMLSYTSIYAGSPNNADGVDFTAPVGTELKSNVAGEVVEVVSGEKPTAGIKNSWGNRIVVVDAAGNKHTYNHLSNVNVKVGDRVSPGMFIGRVGNTGSVMGGNRESLSQDQLNKGRGSHLDYTVFRPDGSKYTVDEAFKFATGTAKPLNPVELQRDTMIALSAIPTQLRNSEAEVAKYEGLAQNLLKQGKSPQDVSDILLGFDITNPNDVPLARKLRTLALSTDLQISDLSRMVNAGEMTQAVNLVETAALRNVDKAFSNTVAAETVMEKIDKANKLSKELGGKAQGVWDEKVHKFIVKFPFYVMGEDTKKAAELAATLTALNAEVRNRFAGTAITESEGQFLDNFLASIKDQPKTMGVKLEQMKSGVLSEVNAARRAAGLPAVDADSLLNRDKRVDLYRNSLMPQTPAPTPQDDAMLYRASAYEDYYSNL